MRVAPLVTLFELGEIETLTLLAIVTCAVQLPDPLTPVPLAVTVMLSIVPPIAFDGMVTLSIFVLSLLKAGTTTGVGTLGDHAALSVADRAYVSSTLPVLLTVTVYVSVALLAPLLELGEIETLTLLVMVTCAVQLLEPLTPVPVAVTVMLSIVPPIAFDGMVTLSVFVPLLNAGTTTGVGTLGDQPELSIADRE